MLGETIRDWRTEQGVSLRELAALSGISAAELSRVEAGMRRLSPMRRLALARATGIDITALMADEPSA